MTYFTLNYTETASMRPVPPPGREEAGGTAAALLSNAHIRRKQAQKSFFGKDQVFIRSVGQFQKLLKQEGSAAQSRDFLLLQGGDCFIRSPGSVEMLSFHVLLL